jgi:hypothetical protein
MLVRLRNGYTKIRHTVPKQSYQAECQLGQCERGESVDMTFVSRWVLLQLGDGN